MHNFDRLTNDNAKKTKFLIVYSFDSCFTYQNNWQYKHFLIDVFPTLFLYENGG